MLLVSLFFEPKVFWPREAYRFEFVLDITQSMNARDYHLKGYPEDRLGFAKAALREAIEALPCGSEVGLGLFTTQSVHFLFEPLEVCEHLPVIRDALSHIDWRMAWSADSHVEFGLYHAIRELSKTDPKTRLVFLTDGQETPPQTVQPVFDLPPGTVKGLLVGVGGRSPVSVPRYDRDNHPIGIWENADIEKAPLSSTVYSLEVVTRALPSVGPYLSFLDEAHLQHLSSITGMALTTLTEPSRFIRELQHPALAEPRLTRTDLRPWIGLLSLILITAVFGIERVRQVPPQDGDPGP